MNLAARRVGAWVLAGALGVAGVVGGGFLQKHRAQERVALAVAEMKDHARRASAPYVPNPLLLVMPNGPLPAQIAAGTLTAATGQTVAWTRSSSKMCSTGSTQDPAQLLRNPDNIAYGVTGASTWGGAGKTVTGNYAIDPSGGNWATRVQLSANSNRFGSELVQVLARPASIGGTWSAQTITFSAYVKATNGTSASFAMQITYGGVADYYSSDFTANGAWQRFVFTQVFPTSASTNDVDVNFAQSTALLGSDIIVSGVKAELGATATPYNFTGQDNQLIRSLPANTPCVEPQGLLVERASTNLLLYSQDLTNAVWNKRGAIVISAALHTAPDGTFTGNHVSNMLGVGSGDIYTAPGGNGMSAPSFYVWRGSTSGTFTAQSPGGPTDGQWTIDLSLLPDAWSRVTVTNPAVTVVHSFNNSCDGAFFSGTTGTPLNFDLWGIDMETGGFPSSYIPTTSSQVTRAFENGSVTNPLTGTSYIISSDIQPTNGHPWADGNPNEPFKLGSRGGPNSMYFAYGGDSNLYQWVYDSTGTPIYYFYTPGFADGSKHNVKVTNAAGTLGLLLDRVVAPGTQGGTGTGLISTQPGNFYFNTNNAPNIWMNNVCIASTNKADCP